MHTQQGPAVSRGCAADHLSADSAHEIRDNDGKRSAGGGGGSSRPGILPTPCTEQSIPTPHKNKIVRIQLRGSEHSHSGWCLCCATGGARYHGSICTRGQTAEGTDVAGVRTYSHTGASREVSVGGVLMMTRIVAAQIRKRKVRQTNIIDRARAGIACAWLT